MQEYIFLIGKSDPFGSATQAIRRAGYKVGIFQDSTILLKDTSNFDKVIPIDFRKLENFRFINAEHIVIVGLMTSYENYIPAKALIGSQLNLSVPSLLAARLCTDKILMRQAFATHDDGLSPAFQMITSAADAIDFANIHGYPVIIKPANLVKSLLVTRCDNDDQLTGAVRHALGDILRLYEKYKIYNYTPGVIIEQFMEGDLYSVAAFVDRRGKVYVCPGITDLLSAQQAGYDDNFLYRRRLPTAIDTKLRKRLIAAAISGVAALDLKSSAAHIELIHTDKNQVKIIEIGARIGGYRPRMYDLSYQTNLLNIEISIATNKPEHDIIKSAKGYTAVYELFPRSTGRFDCLTPELTDNALMDSIYTLRIKVKHGELCGPAREGNKAVAVIIVHNADSEVFVEQCAAVEQIQVRLL